MNLVNVIVKVQHDILDDRSNVIASLVYSGFHINNSAELLDVSVDQLKQALIKHDIFLFDFANLERF